MAEPARNLDDLSGFLVSGDTGDYVFREGEPSREMYIIQQGQVELVKTYAGEERPVTSLEVGDFFGEWSLLEEEPREVSARGVTPYRLLRIDQSAFDQIVREDPEIAIRMLRKLARRLRERQSADMRAAEIAMGGFRGAAPEPALPPPGDVPVLIAGDREFPLSDGLDATVGRADPATGFTPDVDLSPFDSDRTLSRRHARLARRPDGVYVREEAGTRNGTFVNGRRLAAGVEHRLQHGDRIRFGLVETTFRLK
jgi:hypothetical protein